MRPAEHDHREDGLLVLEAEVPVAGGRAWKLEISPSTVIVPELLLQQALDEEGDLGDGEALRPGDRFRHPAYYKRSSLFGKVFCGFNAPLRVSIMAEEMSITLVANGIGLSPLAFQPIVAGRSCLERLARYAAAVRGGEGGPLVLLADGRLPAGAALPPGRAGGAAAGMDRLPGCSPRCGRRRMTAPCCTCTPTARCWTRSWPAACWTTTAGTSPTTPSPTATPTAWRRRSSSPRCCPPWPRWPGKGGEPVRRDTLFELIRRDINAFDLETEISPEDLRLLRVSLTRRHPPQLPAPAAAGRRAAAAPALDAAAVCRALRESPQILRTLPAFFDVQLVEGAPQDALWSPYFRVRGAGLGGPAPRGEGRRDAGRELRAAGRGDRGVLRRRGGRRLGLGGGRLARPVPPGGRRGARAAGAAAGGGDVGPGLARRGAGGGGRARRRACRPRGGRTGSSCWTPGPRRPTGGCAGRGRRRRGAPWTACWPSSRGGCTSRRCA